VNGPDDLRFRVIAFAGRYRLSQREREILAQMVLGVHLKEIGSRIGCAYPTVRTHVRRMAAKLGCGGAREVILKFYTATMETEGALHSNG
jgi:two-component system, NarL family, nitrate/nitrite response regulator NarL